MNYEHELEVAKHAARDAGRVLLKNFDQGHEIKIKDDNSVTVQTDTEAEEAILSVIRREFPTHKILSEESGASGHHPDFHWIIDPLDGTGNFSRGIPLSATSIALLKNDVPIVGVIFNPMTNEMFTAVKGHGAFLNDMPIHPREIKLSKCVMSFVRKERKPEMGERIYMAFSRTAKSVKMLGCEAVELGYLSCGKIDLRVSHGNSAWDYAAGVLIAEEAGCKVTDFDGNPWTLESKSVIAAHPNLHTESFEVIQKMLEE